jgi:NAD(P)H-flavin reductase
MDISNFVIIDERKEKRKIKCVMIDETMMIKYATDNMLNNKIKLLYSNRNSMFLYKDELDMLSSMNKNINIVYTVTGSDLEWKGRFGRIDEDMIKEYCDLDSLFYICGPPSMVNDMSRILKEMGVKSILTEGFTGY